MTVLRETWNEIAAVSTSKKVLDPPKLVIGYSKVTMKETLEYDISPEYIEPFVLVEGRIVDNLVAQLRGKDDRRGNLGSTQAMLESIFIRGFIEGQRHANAQGAMPCQSSPAPSSASAPSPSTTTPTPSASPQ